MNTMNVISAKLPQLSLLFFQQTFGNDAKGLSSLDAYLSRSASEIIYLAINLFSSLHINM